MGIFTIIDDISEVLRVFARRRNEIKKIKGKKRAEICSEISLSDEQKRAIDIFYLNYYGKKIPYAWHRYYTAFTGNFDAEYVPELIYTPEIERLFSRNSSFANVFTDKTMIPMLANSVGIRTPRTIISMSEGLLRDGNYRVINEMQASELLEGYGVIFAKPSIDSNSGRGCRLLNIQNGIDTISNERVIDVIANDLGNNFIIQERIICHDSINQIYSGSVNTFRIITYIWRNEIHHCPVVMRIGQGGSFLDNAHAGGMFIAIDDDGILHKKAFTEFNEQYSQHPDSGFVFENAKICYFDEVLKAAKTLHGAIPQIGIVNWDFTINQQGEPVLIEANMNNGKQSGSIWLPEIAHGKGAFGENTKEILQYIRSMRGIPKSKQKLSKQ